MARKAFQRRIWSWYRRHGRHDLPWRRTRDPYAILVSEVMLQQTQVSRVIPKYREFIQRFPTVQALDEAPLGRVLAVWQGMGYNRRAAYLKRLAHAITTEHGGRIPADPAALQKLPGIGSATAGAVAAFAFGRRSPFIETNIRRAYLHNFFPRRRNVGDREILKKIAVTMPQKNIREWHYALMDYGALALKGIVNPNRRAAAYSRQPPFAGSRRELRGRILAAVIREGTLPFPALENLLQSGQKPAHSIGSVVAALTREGLLVETAGHIAVPRDLHGRH